MPPPRAVLLYILQLLMELISGFVLLLGLSLLEVSSLGNAVFWPATLVGICGTLASLTVTALGLRPPWDRATLLGVAVVTIGPTTIVTSTDPVTATFDLLLFAFVFWRGIAVTGEAPSAAEVERRFGFGFALVFLGIVGVVSRGLTGSRDVWFLVAVAGLAYVVISLVALVAARLERQREPGALSAVVLAVAVQLLLLVGLAVGALQLFSFDMFGWLGHQTQPLVDSIGATLFNAARPFGGVVDRLFSLIQPHASPRSGAHVQPRTGNGEIVRHLRRKPKQVVNAAAWAIGLVIALSFILSAIGYGIWRSLPHRRSEAPPERSYREHRETVVDPRAVWVALLNALRRLFTRSAHVAATPFLVVRHRVWGGPYPTDAVRKTYVQLLRRAAAAGLERRPATTPREFEELLARQWREGTPEFTTITAAYGLRRYGEAQVTETEMSLLQAAWRRARALMRVEEGTDGSSSHSVDETPRGAMPTARDRSSPREWLNRQ